MALRRHVKNFVKHYSEAEIKVREATSNDPWGPSSSLMLEISDLTYNAVSLSEIMDMIWHRLNDHGKNWRHVYKSLTLVDYLLKNGSKKVIQHCQEGYFNIQMLKDFHHLDEAGKDQGFHVREKSKQVIALLTDEQLLHNEREIARRTRRRTSHAMLFHQKAFGKAYVPIVSASDAASAFPPSENVQHFPPKASPAAEQCQPAQISGQAEIVQVTTAFKMGAKSSAEDLIVFSEDEPSTSVQPVFPNRLPREELAADRMAAATTALSSSEINPEPAQKWDSSWKSKSSVISRVMLKSPPRKMSSGTAHRVAATLFNAWSAGPGELSTPKKEVSKADFARCGSSASVETIYLSPAFQAFDPLGKSATNTTKSAPSPSKQLFGPTPSSMQTLNFAIPPNTTQTDQLSSNPSPRPDSISSIRTTSSFSTFSMLSSPESVVPSNTPQPHCIPSQGTPYFSSPHELPSIFFKDLKERITHSFSPFPASDIDENENASVLELLPDNSKCSVQNTDGFRSRTCRASGESWECIAPSSANPGAPSGASLPSTDLLCGSTEQKGMIILEEIKNAACGLRQDFGRMAQELHSITKELTNVTASIQHMSKFLAAAQPAKDAPDPV
ncbi:ENTH domain-containing protein 1 [Tiliqua scincoides]|uniref:ENTH domain-containing protein 1 n=1 Tax=Tiliqua scincoides TaxID=71010 RepID=UPI0034618644